LLEDHEPSVLAEMGVVGDRLPEAQAFHQGETRGIHETEVLVPIAEDDLDGTLFILGGRSLDVNGECPQPGMRQPPTQTVQDEGVRLE
jgi:hypothetical protein